MDGNGSDVDTPDLDVDTPDLDVDDPTDEGAAEQEQTDQEHAEHEAMEAEDAEAYERALELATDDQIEYGPDGTPRLLVDPYEILAEHDHGPAHIPTDPEPEIETAWGTPTVLPEAAHGQPKGSGLGGGKGKQRRRLLGGRGGTGGGGGLGAQIHLSLVSLAGAFSGAFSPRASAHVASGNHATGVAAGIRGKR